MTKQIRALWPGLAVAMVALPIYFLRLDDVAGMVVDDAWYLMLAKALAEGRGYQLVNAPLEGILPGYPPGFPALLSLIFRVRPEFPDNVLLLKSVSIAAMFGVALMSYVYLHRLRRLPVPLAALASLGVATTPALVFLATSTVMSECVFTLLQLGAVVVAHRATEAVPGRASRLVVLAAVLGVATVLVRSVGVAVVAAVCCSFAARGQWKRVSVFAAVVAMCLGPWLLYTRAHAPTAQDKEIHRGSIVYGYGDQFWMRFAGSASSGRVTAADLPGRVKTNAIDIAARSFVGIFAPITLRSAEESGEEVVYLGGQVGWTFIGFGGIRETIAISVVLAAVALWGFVRSVREQMTVAEFLVVISLGITLLWPFWSFRFVLPLTPFLYLYFLRGLPTEAVARVVVLVIVALNVYDHVGYISHARTSDWVANFRELDRTLAWIDDNVDADAVVASTNPAIVHLRTGRKTITLDRLEQPWSVWRGRGAGYAACLVSHELPSPTLGAYKLLYQSTPDRPTSYWVIGLH